jgi:hypothetical protein
MRLAVDFARPQGFFRITKVIQVLTAQCGKIRTGIELEPDGIKRLLIAGHNLDQEFNTP